MNLVHIKALQMNPESLFVYYKHICLNRYQGFLDNYNIPDRYRGLLAGFSLAG